MSDPTLSVLLRFVARETPVRRGEPVTVGLPWPRGAVRDDRQFRLVGPDGTPQVLQTKVLDRWPDGSVRWCLFDWLCESPGETRIEVVERPAPENAQPSSIDVLENGLDNGSIRLTGTGTELKVRTGLGDEAELYFDIGTSDPDGTACITWDGRYAIHERGPIRSSLAFHYRVRAPNGRYLPLELNGRVELFAGLKVIRVSATVRNPNPADHPGGNWDLGNNGSVLVEHLAVRLSGVEAGKWRCSPERGLSAFDAGEKIKLDQGSSGGENWQSNNHITRGRRIPQTFRGYKLDAERQTASGNRATPIATTENGDRFLGLAMPDFWENFPKRIFADAKDLILFLFAPQSADFHELQGGEQKTHTFYVAFGKDSITDEPMVWCRSPLLCHADPEWYASTGVVPYLTPKKDDPNAAYLALVDQAVEGPDTFFHKREVIDEYGWRHYGDIYGDHEAVKHAGPTPLVSHYNNQYDCVNGFAVQFLRSGDPRWWEQMVACADHTCDIDVYHTDGDKAAYNRGLFWHTYHYVDADTGTHRSYPRSLRRGPNVNQTERVDQLGATADKLQKAYAVGGGPSASHNYTTGLTLAYFLTGNPLYRDTAVDLARWVAGMDDPRRTPFRFLSREYTGLATASAGADYHGPGRAAANSLVALLDGFRLTGDRALLGKAEQIVRRVTHPAQPIGELDLPNVEIRWFYTMFLQALGRYLDDKADLGELDGMYAYARASLLHFARWMAANERPILDRPEALQYPTETWAAQDMRKVEVFQFAARHAANDERATFLERAEWFFRYVERTLTAFPTKSLCRPVVLMLNFGWSRAWWQRHPEAAAPPPPAGVPAGGFGAWRMFVPQKTIAVRRAKRLAAAGAAAGLAGAAGLGWWLLR